MNIKRFVLCLALLCVFVAGRAEAAPAKLEVTRDNFVSLEWRVVSRVDENRTLDYSIDKNSISLLPPQILGGFGGGFPPYSPPTVRPLSTNQFEALVRALQLADVPAMAGNDTKQQKPHETLNLTLSDADNADQNFVIVSSDNNAPTNYGKLSDYLTHLIRDKGLAEYVPAAPTEPQK